MEKISMNNVALWTDVFAALADAYVSDKILKSDMKPVVRIIAAIPWIIQGTLNTVNAVNKITNGDFDMEDATETEET